MDEPVIRKELAAQRKRWAAVLRLLEAVEARVEADDLSGAETLLPRIEQIVEEGVAAEGRIREALEQQILHDRHLFSVRSLLRAR